MIRNQFVIFLEYKFMNQPLKKIVNQSLTQLPKVKIVSFISELGTDAVNKSF